MTRDLQKANLCMIFAAALSMVGCGGEPAAGAGPASSPPVVDAVPEAAAGPVDAVDSPAAGAVVAQPRVAAHLTSKTPYPYPPSAHFSPVPEGYEFLMLQHVARHGSRGLSGPDDDDLSAQLWHKARELGSLTPLGEQLGPEVARLTAIHQRIGYGQTSALGKREHVEMAGRIIERHQAFFAIGAETGRRISVSHSGKDRAEESGAAFLQGWLTILPAYEDLIDDPAADADKVYFNSGSAAADYEAYLENDSRLRGVLQEINQLPRTREVAIAMLERLYSPEFVARLDSGEWLFTAREDDEETIGNAVDAALALYGLYSISSNLQDEDRLDFSPFVTSEHAAWLAYVDDAESFYERGPGFAGENITYRGAQVLVEDMLAKILAAATGERNYVADLRFTHAEALMPLATFLGIDGAIQGATLGQRYSYEDNPWRAEWVSPMAANVQWEAFIDRVNSSVLVRMLHHEREVSFAKSCSPIAQNSFFYRIEELERCLLEQGR